MDANPINQKGEKLLIFKAQWKRNMRKTKRASGEEYVSTSGNIVPKKVVGESCRCKYKCFERVQEDIRMKIFKELYKLQNKDLQDCYLCGLLQVKPVERRRPGNNKGHPKFSSVGYKVYYFILLAF